MQRLMFILIVLFALRLYLCGQGSVENGVPTATVSSPSPSVPLVVRFGGSLRELDATPAVGVQQTTFALYQSQTGGEPLWKETQVVSSDNQGRYAVLLGSASPEGIPASVFATGGPRWVGITPNDGIERTRIELASVPYALKAADADTLGGKRSDEFVSLQQLSAMLSGLQSPYAPAAVRWPPVPWPPVVYSSRLPAYEATSQTGPSFISDAITGPPIQVISESLVSHLNVDLLHGLSDSAFAKLRANNSFSASQSFLGGIELPATNPDASTPGAFGSSPLDFESFSTDPVNKARLTQSFRWTTQPDPGATSSGGAQLALSVGRNGATPSSTGLSINADGTINFAPGQQFPTSVVGVGGVGGGATGGGVGGQSNPIVNTSVYPWTQKPSGSLALQVGPNTVTLTPCPRGVNGTDLWHYLYISGTGTPEAVLLTGGSCTSRAQSGTIEFAANYPHPPGYSIGTATDGAQEAIVDATVPNSNSQISRQVMIDPGSHIFHARLSIRAAGMTITSSGATITCAMSDTCIMMGDPSNANQFSSITLSGLRVIPGVNQGTWTAVEDNANGSKIDGLSPLSGVTGTTLGSLIKIDNDQAATINNLNTVTSYSWARCDVTFCSTAVIGPGPFSTNAGVLWVQNSNITLQGTANGIDNQDGNTLQITNSVIQGYAQFGVRASTVYQGVTVRLSGVYFEVGSDANPLKTGSAGVIVEGGSLVSADSGPGGAFPLYANTGSTDYFYYIVVHSSTMGTSPPYLAGNAYTSGTGSIPVLWNEVGNQGVVTYDVLRITGDGGADMTTPNGTGNFSVALNVPQTLCSNKVCSFTDNAASSPSSYTVVGGAGATYWPSLKLWPGTVILTNLYDVQNVGGSVPTQYFTDAAAGGIVVGAGAAGPSVFAQQCSAAFNGSPVWLSCVGGEATSNNYPPIGAMVLQSSANQGAPGGLKGRVIFDMPTNAEVGPTNLITILDSNPSKTMATPGGRPSWDAKDAYIGLDGTWNSASSAGLSFGASASISQYIGNSGDGINYLERLNASGKLFKVPVQFAQVSTGTTANTDITGTIAIAGTTSGTYQFTNVYKSPLGCSLTPIGDTTDTGAFWVTVTNTTVTANIKIPGNISFTYSCWSHDSYVQ